MDGGVSQSTSYATKPCSPPKWYPVGQIHSRVSVPESQPLPRGQNSRLCVTAITSFATFVPRLD